MKHKLPLYQRWWQTHCSVGGESSPAMSEDVKMKRNMRGYFFFFFFTVAVGMNHWILCLESLHQGLIYEMSSTDLVHMHLSGVQFYHFNWSSDFIRWHLLSGLSHFIEYFSTCLGIPGKTLFCENLTKSAMAHVWAPRLSKENCPFQYWCCFSFLHS